MLIAMSGLLLAACPKKQPTLPDASNAPDQSAPRPVAPTATPRSTGSDANAGDAGRVEADRHDHLLRLRPGRDQARVLRDRARRTPQYLDANPTSKVRLEGHSDERGSREYNIGLGERRAQAVRRALMLQGVTEAQITTVSYGEERPAVQGSDEAA